ncbi:MAG: FAD-dependent oxidoreductase [Verrucomicrobiales bacterium]|nr:FAD-dependent oxidoreductase [Verrucomicrobiales bacterium]
MIRTGLTLLALTLTTHAADHYNVVVYGGTSAAVTAAVQTKKMGKSVVIVCPDQHLGGLSSGGLGFTDTGNKAVIGGLSREFYHRLWLHYNDEKNWIWQDRSSYGNKGQGTPAIDGANRTMWIFEPHAAEQVFEDFVKQHDIPVHRDQWLDRSKNGVTKSKDGARITSIRTLAGKTYHGQMFVDATYEGDLIATAGIDYHVGREANSVYDETWNGIQVGVLHHSHWFNKPVSAYKIPGDPDSGVLPRVSTGPPGAKGDGDHRLQAYCYRMCLTNHPDNRIPFPKPTGYDPAQYELAARVFATGWRQQFGKFDPVPNKKTDTNNHGPFSTDNIGMNYDYPDGSYARRAEILAEHKTYQQGLMYFLANDHSVPADVRDAMSKWGLPKDEFTDNGGWPHQIYVREARRMIGKYVMTEHDCLDTKITPDSVGMGSYTLDSHNVQRYIKPDGTVQNEGDIGVKAPRPYEIAYGSLVPKKDQCHNLLAPVCVSSSHIAFGSIRMEPVFMILGQSAATAAAIAIDSNIAVQDVPYADLRAKLVEDGQILEYDGPAKPTAGIDPKTLSGTVIDDSQATLTGHWTTSTSIQPFVHAGYRHDSDRRDGGSTAVFKAELKPGFYQVHIAYSANPNRASNVPITITTKDGPLEVTLDQRKKPDHSNLTTRVASSFFGTGSTVTISNKNTDGHVIIDAVQFIPAKE